MSLCVCARVPGHPGVDLAPPRVCEVDSHTWKKTPSPLDSRRLTRSSLLSFFASSHCIRSRTALAEEPPKRKWPLTSPWCWRLTDVGSSGSQCPPPQA